MNEKKEKLEKKIFARFYQLPSGKEPVRDWIKEQDKETKHLIGEDIKNVELLWPIGYPKVRKLDKDLWEVRTSLPNGIARIFFTIFGKFMVLLHGIMKKSQKTPKEDLDLAKERRNSVHLWR